MPDDAKLEAYRVAQSYLDETGSSMGREKMQTLLDLLRRARGVIYQCSLALAPTAPKAEGKTTQPLTADPSLTTERSPIFENLTSRQNWASGMIFAINTAKKMGCSNFEIDIKEEIDRTPQRARHPYGFMFSGGDEDDWQRETTSCFKVTIYAVTVK